MYKVIKFFTDLQDNGHAYHEGDPFPREGLKVSSNRIEELSGDKNKRGIPLIVFEEEPLPFTEGDEAPVDEVPQEKTSPKKGKKRG